jgi:hypothetical protein
MAGDGTLARRPRRGPNKRARRKARRAAPRSAGAVTVAEKPSAPQAVKRDIEEPRARVATRPQTRQRRGILWQVHGCAALCALAATTGLLRGVQEMSLQFASARTAVALVGACFSAGVVLGLWLPRRVIRARLQRAGRPLLSTGARPNATGSAAGDEAIDCEFAAALTGLLILLVSLIWAALIAVLAGLEAYRGVLTARFMHPAAITWLLLSAPPAVMLIAAGATGTTALVALHGWRRLVAPPGAAVSGLWVIMLGTSIAGAALAATVQLGLGLDAITLIATFAAGILAVIHKPTGGGLPERAATRTPESSTLLINLVAVVAAAAASGAALVAALPANQSALPSAAAELGVLPAAGLVGVIAARGLLRWRPASATVGPPLMLLVVATGWVVAGLVGGAATGVARVALVAAPAATCIVLAGRAVSQAFNRVAPAVAWVGGTAAAGHAIGLALTPAVLHALASPRFETVTALVLTAVAGLTLVFHAGLPRVVRIGGLLVVALWLALAPRVLMPRSAARDHSAGAARAHDAAPLVKLIQTGTRERIRAIGDTTAALRSDIAGPGCAVLVLDAPATTPDVARRILERTSRALLPGGRIVLHAPSPALISAAVRRARENEHPAYVVSLDRNDQRDAALVIGPGTAAWLETLATAPDARVHVTPVATPAEAQRHLTAAPAAP